jgi:hypothetical protein
MGLLDEAIREHLELKRRRGADPGEIAREERAALEPVFAQEPAAADEGDLDGAAEAGEEAALAEEAPVAAEGDAVAPAHETPAHEPTAEESMAPTAGAEERSTADPTLSSLSAIGQETAELDMREVLDPAPGGSEVQPVAAERGHPDAGGGRGASAAGTDLPDWAIPDDGETDPAAEDTTSAGQERLSFE